MNKDIIIRDNSQWNVASVVNLKHQRRKVEHRWRRVRKEISRHQYGPARSAVAQRKKEYYKNQISSCDGNQGSLFNMMDSLMERQSDPMQPHSLSDADLASSFSDFLSEKITHIRRELDFDLSPFVFSVDFNACPRMITTVLLYFENLSLHRLQEINKREKKEIPLFSRSS